MSTVTFLGLEPSIWISLFALILAMGTALQNQRHHKLSVIPNIDISRHSVTNDYALILKSNGQGPAIVKQVNVEINNIVYKLDSKEHMQKLLTEVPLISDCQTIGDGCFLPTGVNFELIKLSSADQSASFALIHEIFITIKWESIYGTKFGFSMKEQKLNGNPTI